jgi:hypothetical protein
MDVFTEPARPGGKPMDPLTVLPNRTITSRGDISRKFLKLGISSFLAACQYVHALPYGYNSNRDDIMILFKEGLGSCTTKHAVIATLARELGLPVVKNIGIYPMTEGLVTGTAAILEAYNLPYLPMVHCFLVYDQYRVDLTENNINGKNGPINRLIITESVRPNISAKEEYLKYRSALKDDILKQNEFRGVLLKTVLMAREQGLELLKSRLLSNSL